MNLDFSDCYSFLAKVTFKIEFYNNYLNISELNYQIFL